MLRFDIRDVLKKLSKTASRMKHQVDSVSMNLPLGTNITFKPNTAETDTAKEIVIFLSDRRVLDSSECCEDCVEAALKSIGEIREFLVQRQLALKHESDSILFVLIEIMLTEIRQFQTYAQKLAPARQTAHLERAEENYYVALNRLRGELLAALAQVANIAKMPIKTQMLNNYPNISRNEQSGYSVTYNRDLYTHVADE